MSIFSISAMINMIFAYNTREHKHIMHSKTYNIISAFTNTCPRFLIGYSLVTENQPQRIRQLVRLLVSLLIFCQYLIVGSPQNVTLYGSGRKVIGWGMNC